MSGGPRASLAASDARFSPGATTERVRSMSVQISAEAQSLGNKAANVVQADISTFERDLERREKSYTRREAGYLERISKLGADLESEATQQERISDAKTREKFNSLKATHSEIMANLDLVKGATSTILQDQEQDLLRAFRARLFDVQTELDREKSKKDDGAATWITKARQLEAEVDWATGMADMLVAKNETLRAENSGLKARYMTGEEDRQYLINQLVSVKKENLVLSADASKLSAEVEALRERKRNMPLAGGGASHMLSPAGGLGDNNIGLTESEENTAFEAAKAKSLNEIKRVKVLLAEQQGALRAARHSYAAELAGRTELQRLLKQCLLDIRQHIAIKSMPSYALDKSIKATLSGGARTGGGGRAAGGGHESAMLEGKSLELLRSQDRVVSMLYHKAFPVEGVVGSGGGEGALPNPLPREMVEGVEVSDRDRRQALHDAKKGEGGDEASLGGNSRPDSAGQSLPSL